MMSRAYFSNMFVKFVLWSSVVITFSLFSVLIADLLWPLLCGNQPLQEPTYLLWEHHWDVQGEKEAWDASTHLRHLWVSIPLHASRYDKPLFPHWRSAFLARVSEHQLEHFLLVIKLHCEHVKQPTSQDLGDIKYLCLRAFCMCSLI